MVHLGCGDGTLTAALRATARYVVHGLDGDPANVAEARRHIRSLGLYGSVSVRQLERAGLPYADNLVDLLIAHDAGAVPMDEILRVLSPGGVACVRSDGQWHKTTKPWPKSIDEWTHWLHGPDGNAVAGDTVAGPPRGMQWAAGPLWSRHHNTVPSVSAMVSARGRVFAIVDEAPPGMHGAAPDKWALVARDAFNGILLWRIPLPEWGWRAWSADWQCRFTVPTHIPRRLVASGERVYATLGFNAPVSEIDAATGELLRVLEGTRFTDEILCRDGLLVLSINEAAQEPARRDKPAAPPVRKAVAALDAATGRILWRRGSYVGLRSKTGSMDRISHLSLAAGQRRVYFADRDSLVGLGLRSGEEAWRVPRPQVPEHKMRYNIRITDMCSLVACEPVVLFAQLDPDRRIDWRQVRGTLHAFSARTGEELWSRPCASWGWGHPADVFVVGGLAWAHDFETPYVLGLDPATGEVKRKVSNFEAFDNGHHHRCYRNKATSRWLVTSYRGLEFIPWQGETTHLNHWVRGTCRLGAFPCNGLVYATPHPCNCYVSAKLNGFVALAPRAADDGAGAAPPPLVRGPAYGEVPSPGAPARGDEWPTYRHDPRRSGATRAEIGPKLERAWQASVGGVPTACTVAEGKVFVASADTHEVRAFGASEGRALWRFTADGPVDTPPSVADGLALLGCAEGWVYCLRAADGRLVWRLRAAPAERLVGAFGRLESAWPVDGGVLLDDGRAYVVAGRSSFLDGGIRAWCLEPRTGRVLDEKTIRTPHAMDVDTGRSQAKYYGARPDLLVSDGEAICMQGRPLFGSSRRAAAPGAVLWASAGMLDDSWFNRTYWFLDGARRGQLLVFDDQAVYAVRAYLKWDANRGFHRPGAGGYTVYAAGRRAPSRREAGKGQDTRGGSPSGAPDWTVRVPLRPTAMVLAGTRLFVAGTPDALDAKRPWAAYEGERGGLLVVLSGRDGSALAKGRLDAPPVYEGLAAAGGRLYIAAADGKILCMEGREPKKGPTP
ncbi:MAG: PQQ-binding-like beta-propeller repeat protein [Candidatus Brocadiia bacterium]